MAFLVLYINMNDASTPQKGDLRRLFIAIAIPQHIATELYAIQKSEEKNTPTKAWRWQHKHDYHISLAFPGHQGADGLAKIKKALSSISFPSFDAYVQGLRCFNRSGVKTNIPHVLWAGLNPAADAYIKELSKVVFAALKTEGITYGRDDVMPHITLAKAKNKDMDIILDIIKRRDEFKSSTWRINEIVLYNSENKSRMGDRNAPHPYKEIQSFKLRAPADKTPPTP